MTTKAWFAFETIRTITGTSHTTNIGAIVIWTFDKVYKEKEYIY
jgi:hypothetical protein